VSPKSAIRSPILREGYPAARGTKAMARKDRPLRSARTAYARASKKERGLRVGSGAWLLGRLGTRRGTSGARTRFGCGLAWRGITV
jgi:hypothetical protein